MIPILLRDDITGKFYDSREALDADRKLHGKEIYPIVEARILAETPAATKIHSSEEIMALRIASIRKTWLDDVLTPEELDELEE